MNRADRAEAPKYWAQAKIIQIWRGHFYTEDNHFAYQGADSFSALNPANRIHIGEVNGQHYFAVNQELSDGPTLRDFAGQLDEAELEIAVTALALINWHETHQSCSRCGAETEIIENGWVRQCPADQTHHFPRTDPAIIVAVQDRNGRLCLGRQAIWVEGRFSNFAGFVEPGESLEAAVAREVKEETDLEVSDIKYLFSQPWPFPNSIMLAFEAFTDNPELARPDGAEIVELKWFTKKELIAASSDGTLNLPPHTTVSRKMIERWLNG